MDVVLVGAGYTTLTPQSPWIYHGKPHLSLRIGWINPWCHDITITYTLMEANARHIRF